MKMYATGEIDPTARMALIQASQTGHARVRNTNTAAAPINAAKAIGRATPITDPYASFYGFRNVRTRPERRLLGVALRDLFDLADA